MPTFRNEASLCAFSGFQALDDRTQSTILRMLRDDRLNNYGGLKRPPNAWLLFRSEMLAANPEMKSISQAEVTVKCKSHWSLLSSEERKKLQDRAHQATVELLQYFPDYAYQPMSMENKAKWKQLGIYYRKEFWVSSAARIAEKIVSPGKPWNGFLTLEKWLDEHYPGASDYLSPATVVTGAEHTSESESGSPARLVSPLRVLRSKHDGRSIRAPIATNKASSFRLHPYNKHSRAPIPPTKGDTLEQAQIGSASRALPPGQLKDVLVPIDSQSSGSQRKRLVLSMFQLKGKMVWVSEIMDDHVSEDNLRKLLDSTGPNEVSTDHLILRDYTDPWVPEAMNKNGELFHPHISSISEYHEYMRAYHSSQERGLDFVWPAPPWSPSATALPIEQPDSPVVSVIRGTAPQHSGSQNSSVPEGNPTLQ